MNSKYPGEFIHMILVEAKTLLDGKAVMFISVDHFSRFCFSHAVAAPLSFEKISAHVDSILSDISSRHPGIIPTFIMAYGEQHQFTFAALYKGRAAFRFDSKMAHEI